MDTLTDAEVQILHEALDDEYRAWATYDQVIADFGEVRPFINIREAEARHIQALLRLFERYGLAKPANPWPGKAERYTSLQAACEAGVVAEIANGEMYSRLLGDASRGHPPGAGQPAAGVAAAAPASIPALRAARGSGRQRWRHRRRSGPGRAAGPATWRCLICSTAWRCCSSTSGLSDC